MPNPLHQFLDEARRIRRTGNATQEQSYYPGVNALLTEAGKHGPIRRTVLSHPVGVQGQFPDLALYEASANVLALPVEVKPASDTIQRLVRSSQALRYARTFGGGVVLLTNLREWAVAEVDEATGILRIRKTVTVAVDEPALDNPASASTLDLEAVWLDLQMMVSDASTERANLHEPKLVARLLAYHAREMRDSINRAGDSAVLLASLNEALARGLNIELDDEHLTPTVVQTLVYGAFAAWLAVEEPQKFDWMQASYRLTVPVFAEILHAALRPTLLRKCDLTPHLRDVERVLRWTDRNKFTTAFDGDAIQYFYEPFLAEFDENLRNALGVWYTPKEIAAYQVARSHHHLVNDLQIADGLASDEVYVLDPAVGTGTYLIAASQYLFDHHVNNGEHPNVAASRTLEALTTRFIGFEILPAAFIICHLHLTRFAQQLGGEVTDDHRLRVYLTNSLTGWDRDKGPQGLTLFPELESELRDAAVAKHTDPVVVVLGNPPYHGYSAAESDEEKAMVKPWIDALHPVWGIRKHRMNDLYVRFWRMSLHRIIELTERGVVSFITNRKWLGGRSYPSMREAVVNGFHDMWVDDLHGDVHDRSHLGDQSIFTTSIATGIQVGTAIVTGVRRATAPTGLATVHLAEYRGTADDKRAELNKRRGDAINTGYTTPTVTKDSRYRFVADSGVDFPPLDEYLPMFSSGLQPVTEAVLDADRTALEARMKDYFDLHLDWAALTSKYPVFALQRSGYNPEAVRKRLLADSRYDPAKVTKFLPKPFERRWLYWETEARLLHRARPDLFPFWAHVPGQMCIIAPQARRRVGAARLLAGHPVAQFEAIDPNARVFPLYTFTTGTAATDPGALELEVQSSTEPTNVAAEWVSAAQAALGGVDAGLAGETVFYALVAISSSPKWLLTQPVDFDDFPTLPIPADPADLTQAAQVGREIAALMDPFQVVLGVTSGAIRANLQGIAVPDTVAGTEIVEYGTYGQLAGRHEGGHVYWNGNHKWNDVPEEVWSFRLGGFESLGKWLSYRKGTGITVADRETFMLIARRIRALLDTEPVCDRLYNSALANPLMPTAPSAA